MSTSPLGSPVVLDASLSDEKIAELLGHQALGAMQVRGSYVVAGVDGHGRPTGDLDDVDPRGFDEATLAPRLQYLPEPLELRTRVVERDGHRLAVIYVARHPTGCAIFKADGQYEKDGDLVVRFRAGEVFWRDGTRSVRMT